MKKLLYLVVLGAVAIAACGGSSNAVAATVDGTEVTVSDVEALVDTEGASIPNDQFAQYLAAQIQWNIFFDAAEADYGVTATDAEVEAEATRLVEELAAGDQSRADFLAERGLTEEFLANIARQSAVDTKIREQLREDAPEPAQEEIDAALNAAKAPLTQACVSHILVGSEQEANEVMTRLGEGEEFGALASELSTDPGSAESEGVLPCGTLETYVEPFRDAALVATVGEVHPEPVESQFGFHVILVTERTDAAASDLPTNDELTANAQDSLVLTDLQEWFNGVMQNADVSVNEEYGTWQANPPMVNPPAGDGATSTTTSE